jgi:4-hydroxybenzoate polyprenyltransferase
MAAYRMELSIDEYLWNVIKCFFAAFIVRSSACTVNDIFDRKMDAGVGKSYYSEPYYKG